MDVTNRRITKIAREVNKLVIRAMKETGVNLDHRFRETSEGGLAKLYDRRKRS